ncbi:hypothetical protein ACFL4W_02055 [Planctomycetota bacterium]
MTDPSSQPVERLHCAEQTAGDAAKPKSSLIKKLIVVLAMILVLICGWHTGQALNLARINTDEADMQIKINPLTNAVTMQAERQKPEAAKGGENIRKFFAESFSKGFKAKLEKRLNQAARERFDVYAMLIPYRVTITEVSSGE